jgi:hypothetical protein
MLDLHQRAPFLGRQKALHPNDRYASHDIPGPYPLCFGVFLPDPERRRVPRRQLGGRRSSAPRPARRGELARAMPVPPFGRPTVCTVYSLRQILDYSSMRSSGDTMV